MLLEVDWVPQSLCLSHIHTTLLGAVPFSALTYTGELKEAKLTIKEGFAFSFCQNCKSGENPTFSTRVKVQGWGRKAHSPPPPAVLTKGPPTNSWMLPQMSHLRDVLPPLATFSGPYSPESSPGSLPRGGRTLDINWAGMRSPRQAGSSTGCQCLITGQ